MSEDREGKWVVFSPVIICYYNSVVVIVIVYYIVYVFIRYKCL